MAAARNAYTLRQGPSGLSSSSNTGLSELTDPRLGYGRLADPRGNWATALALEAAKITRGFHHPASPLSTVTDARVVHVVTGASYLEAFTPGRSQDKATAGKVTTFATTPHSRTSPAG
jgi:hypothetical protein